MIPPDSSLSVPAPGSQSQDSALRTQHSAPNTQDSGLRTQDFSFHHSSFIIHHFSSLSSTQTLARELVQSGRPMHGVVLWAATQTAGHGRTGRAWSSDPGGLYVTVCLPRGEIAPAHIGWLPLMAALAAAEELESRFNLHPELKWPNDILITDRKIAGVIGDAMPTPQGEVYLIGLGLNFSNSPQTDIPTTCLSDLIAPIVPIGPISPISPIPPTPQPCTTAQRDFLLAWLDRLGSCHREMAENGDQAAEALRLRAEAKLWRRDQPVRFERTEFGPVEGTLTGLGPGGSAIIESPGQLPRAVYCGNAERDEVRGPERAT
ncbi:biotin--[acetyl-CoA-carboxylase] ligase [bacterium]|nr:biotin--[acetyl-CoA-carboxylase] ligase [bacterium]